MKIKKLTIHGFKSFVDKTTLDFSSGTSAIIGPNGCGKSNIVDAIRWVIGEQNARQLRGKSMEDVIFSGSESRKPLGMAEVVLTFSNEDGTAPARYANFTEIEIARRLYRSGESEYYINKVQSRLRDIIDLFTDTGIGTRYYSIVEQGQVGWLVSAKPEERRAIFEEAAGINKFKHKKQAAIRRLDATRENLDRVNDIISEVKRQLNSLNRQAKKAERYKAAREELRDVDLTLYSMELAALEATLADFTERLEKVTDEEMALTNTISMKEGLTEELKGEYLEAESAFKEVREKAHKLERAIDEKERRSELINARVEELGRNEERLEAEIRDLRERSEAERSEAERLAEVLEGLTSETEEKTRNLEEKSSELDSLTGELRAMEEARKTDKTEGLRLSTRLADIRHTIQGLLKDEETAREREARASSEAGVVAGRLSEMAEPLEETRRRLDEAGAGKDSIEKDLAGARERFAGLESEKERLTGDLDRLKDERSAAVSRLAALEEMERNHENLRGGARSIMQKEDLGGVHGILADCFETEPGYETAVEAVLGERLQYVIVESHREGVEAIEYLKQNSAGRGSFVPVKDLRPSAQPVPTPRSGSFMPEGASELAGKVRVKEGFGDIMNYLLGGTLVVDDLETALDAWRQNGFYRTLVTRDGEIIDPQGVISGGAGSSEGILRKKAEIKELSAAVSEAEEKIGRVASELERTGTEMESASRSVEDLREKLHSADVERVNLESELKGLEAEEQRLRTRAGELGSEKTGAAEDLSAIAEKKADLVSEREEVEAELARVEEKTDSVAEEISALRTRREELSSTVTEMKVDLAQVRERCESVRKELAGRQSTATETASRVGEKSSEIEMGREEAEGKREELAGLKSSIDELLAEVDGVKADEVARGEALGDLEEKAREVERELKGLKARVSELAELKGELTIESRETQIRIENLKERSIEKYGVEPSPWEEPAEGEEAAAEGEEAPEAAETPDPEVLKHRRDELRENLEKMGSVNLSALEEYQEQEERYNFLLEQQTDLYGSVESLEKAISRINRTTKDRFTTAFEEINAKFKEAFPKFFRGGKAELRLVGDDILEAGIDIVAQPPGKSLKNISLLSGGEKALTATSLVFSIFLTKPSPFCLLDEVDAPLDDANIEKFNGFVHEMSEFSQFLIITHNKKTMEIADSLYGVTMEDPGISKIVTLDM